MCHSIIYYYALCRHLDQGATHQIACHSAFITGYECTEEPQSTSFFSLIGNCLQCKLNHLMLRQSVYREWRREDLLEALNDAFQYSDDDDWTTDDSDAEELDMETLFSQSPTDRAENRETRASFHSGPARMPTIMQQSSPHLSFAALVEHADDYADDEEEYVCEDSLQEPQPRVHRSWRSWIPLPTRLERNQQAPSYMALVTDDYMGDTEFLFLATKPKEYRRTWRSWIPLPAKKVSGQ
ncbi:hypothetical protein N7449_001605 [Penicillium cf. viridicatum]|uniref:Uncharacterized protein n=1 Tax=Penicillium cf. viridicatum TaxID=2972119 RepID=A0A9W9N741_9EURO|nr:hypothetical protein N7449_001605 [Penicillium cf. viridicatum]